MRCEMGHRGIRRCPGLSQKQEEEPAGSHSPQSWRLRRTPVVAQIGLPHRQFFSSERRGEGFERSNPVRLTSPPSLRGTVESTLFSVVGPLCLLNTKKRKKIAELQDSGGEKGGPNPDSNRGRSHYEKTSRDQIPEATIVPLDHWAYILRDTHAHSGQ